MGPLKQAKNEDKNLWTACWLIHPSNSFTTVLFNLPLLDYMRLPESFSWADVFPDNLFCFETYSAVQVLLMLRRFCCFKIVFESGVATKSGVTTRAQKWGRYEKVH